MVRCIVATLTMGVTSVIVILLGLTTLTIASRILAVFPVPSISHQVVYRALTLGLQARGHELVVLTTDPIEASDLANYTQINLSHLYGVWQKRLNFAERREEGASVVTMVKEYVNVGANICDGVLSHPEVTSLINQHKHERFGKKIQGFDLVISEMTLTPCAHAFAPFFGTPLIGITSLPASSVVHMLVANPTHPAYAPDPLLGFIPPLNFRERVISLIFLVFIRIFYLNVIIPRHDKIAKHHFGQDTPYLLDVCTNVSLLFDGSTMIHDVRPTVPAFVRIGGIHLNNPKPLPKELKDFLDGAVSGAIYFSLGTNVRGDAMSPEKRQMFVDVFAGLPHFRVLWKYDGDSIPGLPQNVMIRKWFPQQDVLAHPKIKLFIYQGGLQSTEEAIHAEVPVIAIPFLADQDLNAKKMRKSGTGLYLDFKYLSKEGLQEAVGEVLFNSSYRENMKKLSNIVKDQPETSLERAIWWTEYVIRHKGARHLRSPALDLTWYEYLLLDVIAFLVAVLAFSVWLLSRLVKLVFRLFRFRKPRVKTD